MQEMLANTVFTMCVCFPFICGEIKEIKASNICNVKRIINDDVRYFARPIYRFGSGQFVYFYC